MIIDPIDEYDCVSQRHRIWLRRSFDPAKSWRLRLSVASKGRRKGSIFTWGDNRPGLDVIVLYANPGNRSIQGRICDTRHIQRVVYLSCKVDWSAPWTDVELSYNAEDKTGLLRVGDEESRKPIPFTPTEDRQMPVWVGGTKRSALHSYPCRVRNLRLEQQL